MVMTHPRFGGVHPAATGMSHIIVKLDGEDLTQFGPQQKNTPVLALSADTRGDKITFRYGFYPMEPSDLGPAVPVYVKPRRSLRDRVLAQKFRAVLNAVPVRAGDDWMRDCLDTLGKALDRVAKTLKSSS